jgi:hypothetical protein
LIPWNAALRSLVYGAPGGQGYDGDRRWPRWASLLFIVATSMLLWALIIGGVWWWVASD